MAKMTRCDVNSIPDVPASILLMCDKHDNLCVAHLNIQKLCAKQPDIIHDALLHKCDIVCFIETHLCQSDLVSPGMFGFDNTYALFSCDHGSNGGGAGSQKNFNHSYNNFEGLRNCCSSGNAKNHAMYIMRPPHCNVLMWINEVTKYLK